VAIPVACIMKIMTWTLANTINVFSYGIGTQVRCNTEKVGTCSESRSFWIWCRESYEYTYRFKFLQFEIFLKSIAFLSYSDSNLHPQDDHTALCHRSKQASSQNDAPKLHHEDTVGDGHAPLATNINSTAAN